MVTESREEAKAVELTGPGRPGKVIYEGSAHEQPRALRPWTFILSPLSQGS